MTWRWIFETKPGKRTGGLGTTSGCFGLGVLPRLRAVQFNRNFQPRRDAIVFGETGREFAVLK